MRSLIFYSIFIVAAISSAVFGALESKLREIVAPGPIGPSSFESLFLGPLQCFSSSLDLAAEFLRVSVQGAFLA